MIPPALDGTRRLGFPEPPKKTFRDINIDPRMTATGGIEAYIRQAAQARGINPDVAVRVAKHEGGLTDPVRQADAKLSYGREESYGPFQLHIRQGGLGARALQAGIDPRDPNQWQRGVDFALDEVKRDGWSQWYGAKASGIGKWDGVNGRAMTDKSPVSSWAPTAQAPSGGVQVASADENYLPEGFALDDDEPAIGANMPTDLPTYQVQKPSPKSYLASPMGPFNGVVSAGNIDLAARPVTKNPDGSISTVRSMSFQDESGKEILVPTVAPDGHIMSDQEAIDLYRKTGQNLGKFDTPEAADQYAQALHNSQEQYYGGGSDLPDGFALDDGPAVNPATNQPGNVPAFDPGVPGYDPQTGEVTKPSDGIDSAAAFAHGALDLPIVGPALTSGAKAAAAGIVYPFQDKPYSQVYDQMSGIEQGWQQDHPVADMAGQVVGGTLATLPLGSSALGAKLLGQSGASLAGRMGFSAASNAAINGADTAVRGGSAGDVTTSAALGAGLGGAMPALGRAAGAAWDSVADHANSLFRPSTAGAKRVGRAFERDTAAGKALGANDEASAGLNDQPLMNVDRGGPRVRALGRSAMNNDAEARDAVVVATTNRATAKPERARSFIDRLAGGDVDHMAAKEELASAAKAANGPAYKKAMSSPAAQDMWDDEFAGLMKAPAIQQAAKDAVKRGANRAAADGSEVIKNPFKDVDGVPTLADDGTRPTLQFWNQVKINLDDEINAAQRAGKNGEAGDLIALKQKLVSKLDKAVPEYKDARAGAAAFFGADNALDAGKKFVRQSTNIKESAAAIAKMNPAERESFAVGFASELKEATKGNGDAINKIFGSPQAKEKVRIALGPKNFAEFEQFVKVEHIMDQTKRLSGGSNTTEKLIEAGLATIKSNSPAAMIGLGTGLYSGDYKTGLGAAAAAKGAKFVGGKINERMVRQIATMLTSDDPEVIKRAVGMARRNPQAAKALDAIYRGLDASVKSSGDISQRPEKKLLEITVREPAGVEP